MATVGQVASTSTAIVPSGGIGASSPTSAAKPAAAPAAPAETPEQKKAREAKAALAHPAVAQAAAHPAVAQVKALEAHPAVVAAKATVKQLETHPAVAAVKKLETHPAVQDAKAIAAHPIVVQHQELLRTNPVAAAQLATHPAVVAHAAAQAHPVVQQHAAALAHPVAAQHAAAQAHPALAALNAAAAHPAVQAHAALVDAHAPPAAHTAGPARIATSSEINTSRKGSNMSAEHNPTGHRVTMGISQAAIAAGATADIRVRPQVNFQVDRIEVSPSLSAFFVITGQAVGVRPQVAAAGDQPADCYSPDAQHSVNWEVCDTGTDIIISVRNVDAALHDFRGILFGHVHA